MYFKDLKDETKQIIKDLVIEAIETVEGWKASDETLEDIECKSRDGFIPFASNRGGIIANQFTDLYAMWSSGNSVSHKPAQKEIERQIEYSLKCARESFFENNTEQLRVLGIDTAEDVSYHDLYDKGQSDLAEDFRNYESENLSDDSSSIMLQVRFLYHGQDDDGLHSASVSCAVNTEGPYHRSHISWAPNVFCEGAKEVEIEWKTDRGLKQALTRALNKASSEVF